MRPRFTPLVAGLPATVPFVGPETLERRRGRPFAARLGANECGFGPSPEAVAAMRDAAGEMWRYCDSTSHDLRQALAARHGIDPARITVGEGIDGLLGNTMRLFVEPGDRVVTSAGAYPTFNYHVAGFGGVLETVPYAEDRQDSAALVTKVRESGARMVYFCNPDNPMGAAQPAAAARRLLDGLPEDCVLVLDEAYIDYAPDGTAPGWDLDDPRLIRFRTFSKAHALAGLRIGWAVGDPAVIAGFERIRNHFGVNRMAQTPARPRWPTPPISPGRSRRPPPHGRAWPRSQAQGLMALPSATNFVAIDCGRDGVHARAVLTALEARGVFVRMPGVAPLDRCIRVSAGPEAEIEAFAAALPGALDEAAAAAATAG